MFLNFVFVQAEQNQKFLLKSTFRFKKGMKSKLLDQVASDNPEGMGSSSKGWEVPVGKLKDSSPEWVLLTSRCARENVRDMIQEWYQHRRNIDKT